MRVKVQRDPDLAMPEALADDLRMHSRGQHVSCVGMAQIMEADAGQGACRSQPNPFVSEAIRLYRLAVRLGYHERLVRWPHADSQKLLGLCNPVRPEFGHHGCR